MPAPPINLSDERRKRLAVSGAGLIQSNPPQATGGPFENLGGTFK